MATDRNVYFPPIRSFPTSRQCQGRESEIALREPGVGAVHREPHVSLFCVPVHITQDKEKVSADADKCGHI